MFSTISKLLGRSRATVVEAAPPVKRRLTEPISKPLVWIDCEMTGLNVSQDHIIEICCLITDSNLNLIDENGYESTVYVPKKVLDGMDEWCVTHHGSSGLTAKVLANPLQTLSKVQQELLEYIQSYIPEPRTAVIAGNTIHMDKFFMMKEFPQVIDHLHYRMLDVSAIMEMGVRHNPKLMKLCPPKVSSHTARSDIVESIAQLKWYRQYYLRNDVSPELSAKKDKPNFQHDSVEHIAKRLKSEEISAQETAKEYVGLKAYPKEAIAADERAICEQEEAENSKNCIDGNSCKDK